VAQSWLVPQLTRSGALLGLVAAAQFLPVLLLGPYGGLLADQVDKRRLLDKDLRFCAWTWMMRTFDSARHPE
jgi:nitrate/nitrite transporter NarK